MASILRLRENMVLTVAGRQKRVLWIDETLDWAVLIDIRAPQAKEYFQDCTLLQDGLDDGTIIEADDLYRDLTFTAESYSDARRKVRDENADAMRVLTGAPPEQRFDRKLRAGLIRQITSRSKDDPLYRSKKHAYRLWRRWCQRGQVDNTFLGDYQNGGWSTEKRRQNPPKNKLGRNRKVGPKRAGVVLTPPIEDKLFLIGRLYFNTRDPRSKKKRNWREAHEIGCRRFFRLGWKKEDGVRVEIMPPKDKLPSVGQLKRVFYSRMHADEIARKRAGERAYNLKHRPLHGDQREVSWGPMHLVQIDAQVGKIYLVHRNPAFRHVVGRPTIVLAKDTMSRMIVGIAITFEHESVAAYKLCLINMATDKVHFYDSFGIQISEDEFPVRGLADGYLSDNGAMIAEAMSEFQKATRIRFLNCGGDRPDMKPVVESGFHDLNEKLVFTLPGAVLSESTDPDADPATKRYKENATLDIDEFTRAVLYYVRDHNRRVLVDYPMTDAMKGAVNPIPLELFNWGIRVLSGAQRGVSAETVLAHCLTRGRARVTREGIIFKQKSYECERSNGEHWQNIAKDHQEWWEDILYNPDNLANIYLPRDKQRKPGEPILERCWRTRARGENTAISLTELLKEQEFHETLVNELSQGRPQRAADLNAHIQQIVKGASEKTRAALHGQKQSTDNLKIKRAIAIAEEREASAPFGSSRVSC